MPLSARTEEFQVGHFGAATARAASRPSVCAALVAIADRQEFARLGLESQLKLVDCDVVGMAESATGLLSLELPKSTVVIVDPWSNGLYEDKSWRELVEQGYRVLVYTEGPLNAVRKKLISGSGAKGCVLKPEPAGVLLEAISLLHCGHTYFSAASRAGREDCLKLTPRELEIAKMLAAGGINKEIAGSLGLSVRTVETHRINLRRKLRIDNISELTRFLMSEGLA